MKIIYNKNLNRLEFKLRGNYPISDWEYTFSFPVSNYVDAAQKLLIKNLQEAFFNEISEARSKAYADGWKDAKSKRKRKEWFSGYLGDLT